MPRPALADHDLDATFAALADPTRRAILARLSKGDATVLELAEPFALSQPAISKHIKVLERAGLISRGRDAQRRPCRIDGERLEHAAKWLGGYRKFWEASYERLDEYLKELQGKEKPRVVKKLEIIADPDKPTIVTRRVFDAPRALVFDAFTKPEHLRRWMGPRSVEMVSCESDLRVGGRYRFTYRAPDGQELVFSGEYRQVEPPARIVRTFVFEAVPDHEALETLELEERDGKTTITTLTVHKTIEGRDGHLLHGMERGMTEGYERLDELLGAQRIGHTARA